MGASNVQPRPLWAKRATLEQDDGARGCSRVCLHPHTPSRHLFVRVSPRPQLPDFQPVTLSAHLLRCPSSVKKYGSSFTHTHTHTPKSKLFRVRHGRRPRLPIVTPAKARALFRSFPFRV
jgi:hypothetical protein